MPPVELVFALTALLLTPGPSNTLMLISGADRGFRASLALIPVEVLAYLAVTAPLALLARSAPPQLEVLRPAITILAGLWVLILARHLWRIPATTPTTPAVTAGTVFVTTLLNPKALIFGLVLLPMAPLVQGLGLFTALVILVAALWAGLGALLPQGAEMRGSLVIRRAAACWLAVLSVGLFANGFTA